MEGVVAGAALSWLGDGDGAAAAAVQGTGAGAGINGSFTVTVASGLEGVQGLDSVGGGEGGGHTVGAGRVASLLAW